MPTPPSNVVKPRCRIASDTALLAARCSLLSEPQRIMGARGVYPMFSNTATHAVPREGFLAFARQRYSRDWSRTRKLSVRHTRNHTPSCLRSRDHRNTELRCRLAWVDSGGLRTAGTWGIGNVINVNRNATLGCRRDQRRE